MSFGTELIAEGVPRKKPRKKRKGKPPEQVKAVSIKMYGCTEYAAWFEGYCTATGRTVAKLLEDAVALDARMNRYPIPPPPR